MRRAETLEQAIHRCAEEYNLSIWRNKLADADEWWARLQVLRHERDRTLTPAQIRAAYGQVGRR